MSSFLRFLPSSRHIAVVSLKEKTAKYPSTTKFLDAADPGFAQAVYDTVQNNRAKGYLDHYISLGSFEPARDGTFHRTANYAREFRSLYVDLDCHGGENDYASVHEAAAAIDAFVDATGLPYSAAVLSGRGIGVYWTFAQDISQARWRLLTADLYALLIFHGIKYDPAVYGDRARIVRLPGTKNSKSGTVARIAASGGPVWNVERFAGILDSYTIEHAVPPVPEPEVVRRDGDACGTVLSCRQNSLRTRQLLRHIPADFTGTPMANGKYAADSYAKWRNVVWALKQTGLPDAWELAVEWASRASDKYDDLMTALQRTWDSDKDDGAGISAGTLVYIAQQYASSKRANKFLSIFHWADAEEAAEVGDTTVVFDAQEPEIGALLTPEFEEAVQILFAGGPYVVKPRRREGSPPPLPAAPAEPVTGIPAVSVAPVVEGSVSLPVVALAPLEEADPEFIPDRFYGGPEGDLPHGFHPPAKGAGFGIEKKMPGSDDDEVKLFVPVSHVDIELVDSRVAWENGTPNYSHIFRAYDSRTQQPLSDVELPGATLNDTSGMARWVGQYMGLPFGMSDGGTKAMSLYFKALASMRASDGPPTPCITQGGWQSAGGSGDFALNTVMILEDGRYRESVTSPEMKVNLRGVGELAGTMQAQKEILECWGQPGNICGQAVICLVASAPLAVFTPHPGGISYTHGTGSGTGKSTAHKVALGLYGDPEAMTCPGTTTGAGRQIIQVYRRDIPVYVDDYATGPTNRPDDPRNRAVRDDFLQSSQCHEKVRAAQSGRTRSTGDRTWHAPLNLTINKRLEAVIPDNGGDTEAVFARVLVIDWEAKRFDRRSFGPALAGLTLESAIRQHYGHIGRQFIAYVQTHKKAVKARIEAVYQSLDALAAERQAKGAHRFHNSMIASATVFAEWARDCLGLSWDFDALIAYMRDLPVLRAKAIEALASNDIESVWSGFLAKFTPGAILAPPAGSNARVMDDNARSSEITAIRIDQKRGMAYVAKAALNSYTISRGVALTDIWKYLRDSFPNDDAIPNLGRPIRMNITEGVSKRLRLDTYVYPVPLASVLSDQERPVAANASNVVQMRSK